jgi:hypothetical protein
MKKYPLFFLLLSTQAWGFGVSFTTGRVMSRPLSETSSVGMQPVSSCYGILFHNFAAKSIMLEWGAILLTKAYQSGTPLVSTSHFVIPFLWRGFPVHFIGIGFGPHLDAIYQQKNAFLTTPYLSFGLTLSLATYIALTKKIRLVIDGRAQYSPSAIGPQTVRFLDFIALAGITLGFR